MALRTILRLLPNKTYDCILTVVRYLLKLQSVNAINLRKIQFYKKLVRVIKCNKMNYFYEMLLLCTKYDLRMLLHWRLTMIGEPILVFQLINSQVV